MSNGLEYKIIKPDKELSDFVDSFWFLRNQSDADMDTTGLPDGLIDILLFKSATEPFQIVQLGGLTQYEQAKVPPNSLIFCVSFKLLAAEYILGETISNILNSGKLLPEGFW